MEIVTSRLVPDFMFIDEELLKFMLFISNKKN